MGQKIGWLLLVSYTLIHLGFYGSFVIDPIGLLTFDGEPLLVALFYLMALFPLFFLMVSLSGPKPYQTQTILLHALGFMVGAFALLPIVSFEKKPFPTLARRIRLVLTGCALAAFALLTYGIVMGSLSMCSEMFYSDSLIHIMTIDFFILYAMSVVVAKKRFKRWPIAFIPVVGAFGLLSFSNEEIS